MMSLRVGSQKGNSGSKAVDAFQALSKSCPTAVPLYSPSVQGDGTGIALDSFQV